MSVKKSLYWCVRKYTYKDEEYYYSCIVKAETKRRAIEAIDTTAKEYLSYYNDIKWIGNGTAKKIPNDNSRQD